MSNQNTIKYRQVGDYLIPNLVLPPEEANIRLGKLGMLHKDYLLKHKKVLFATLLAEGKLYQHCAVTEKQARYMFGTRVDPISGEIKTHGGTDIAAPLGTPILAVADGVVVTATWHNSYGYYVKIKHDDTYSTLYAHCSALYVSVGQTVKQGQVIADCGSTGDSTGNHLHFEVLQNGIRVDSLMFFSKI